MGKFVVLKLEGDLEQCGFHVSLEVADDGQFPELETTGFLPANPNLADELTQWRDVYQRLSSQNRGIKPQGIQYDGAIYPIDECIEAAQALGQDLKQWLSFPSFREMELRLREAVSLQDSIRILIRTSNPQVHQLPWHLWDVLERYPNAEIAFGTRRFRKPLITPPIRTDAYQVRILAILGDRTGIDIEQDRQMLSSLPGAEVCVLAEPSLKQFHEALWEEPWDILFFAGHSETVGDAGILKLNAQKTLTVAEIHHAVKRAIANGLQLAIFNSCDGLGLARGLAELQLPQMIVMRMAIPDPVAQEFLKYFLASFAQGASLYEAERDARERLQGLEDQFPCASWLPVIYQHPSHLPKTWQELQSPHLNNDALAPSLETVVDISQPSSSLPDPQVTHNQPRKLWHILAVSILVSLAVVGLRGTGWLEARELSNYDHLMQQRPVEQPDERITIVGADEEDLRTYGHPLPDHILADVHATLNEYGAATIGIDIIRDQPVGDGYDRFLQQITQHPTTTMVCAWGNPETQPIGHLSELSSDQVSFINFLLDPSDAVIRRSLLSITPNPVSTVSPCTATESLGLRLSRYYFDHHQNPMTKTDEDLWQIGGTTILYPLQSHLGGYHQFDDRGYQIMLNYRATEQIAQPITINQLLNQEFNPDWIRDRVVLVGVTAPSIHDNHPTPYGTMRGIEIHAHIVSQVLSKVLDQRPQILSLPLWGDLLWLLGWASLSGISIWAIYRYTQRSMRFILIVVMAATLSSLVYGISIWALTQGTWLPVIPTILAVGTNLVVVASLPDILGFIQSNTHHSTDIS